MTPVAALFVARGGCYFGLPDVDPWDEQRDARLYVGPYPVVAHPPCERWGRYWYGGPSAKVRRVKGDDSGCLHPQSPPCVGSVVSSSTPRRLQPGQHSASRSRRATVGGSEPGSTTWDGRAVSNKATTAIEPGRQRGSMCMAAILPCSFGARAFRLRDWMTDFTRRKSAGRFDPTGHCRQRWRERKRIG